MVDLTPLFHGGVVGEAGLVFGDSAEGLAPSKTASAVPRGRLKSLLLKHVELMKTIKQPMFKLKPSFPLQTLPPPVETDLLTQQRAKNKFKFLEALKRGDSPYSVTVPIESNPATGALHLALKSDSDQFGTALIDAEGSRQLARFRR